MIKKNIYLIRHGEIDCGKEKKYIGISDIPLNANGVKQANKLKSFFNEIPINKLYCSDLQRAVETARIIAENKNVDIVKLEELREINMGNWEGKTFKEIKTKFPQEFEERINRIETFKPHGGESFGECKKRAINILRNICKDDSENIIIVSHAGVNRIIIAYILQIPINNIFKYSQDYGCINKIVFDNTNYKIKYINYTL